MTKIGIVGVGLMGRSLAMHLLNAGYTVFVHDLVDANIDAAVKLGAQRVGVPAEMTSKADVIMLSLPNSNIVNDVVQNGLCLFESSRKDLVLIDTSTPDPETSIGLARRLREHGIEMLDATISGTSEMFVEKDVIFMVGGTEAVYNDHKDIFATLAKDSYFLGPNGAGGICKLVANCVLTLNRFALAEGLTLAKKAGLDQEQTLAVLKKSAAYSKAMDQKGMRMVKRQFDPPASRLSSSYKDARLILSLGARIDCPLPLMSLAVQAMASEVAKGHQNWDPATMISFYNNIAGFDS
ncbi:MAG: NAD(P)-dependent oxidoreductase [Betaproteobacteria bacterium]|nr:NAD(P)-dependent oxidoreductase [Betaproteobacteria bacterium]